MRKGDRVGRGDSRVLAKLKGERGEREREESDGGSVLLRLDVELYKREVQKLVEVTKWVQLNLSLLFYTKFFLPARICAGQFRSSLFRCSRCSLVQLTLIATLTWSRSISTPPLSRRFRQVFRKAREKVQLPTIAQVCSHSTEALDGRRRH